MFGVIFGSFCCAYLGISMLKQYYKDEHREYVLIQGNVVRSDISKLFYKNHHGIGYIPVFEYYYNNKIYQVEHRVESSKYGRGMKIVPNSKYHVGDRVELRVYIDEPEYAIANDKNNIRLPLYVGIPLTLLSAVLLCIAAAMIFST